MEINKIQLEQLNLQDVQTSFTVDDVNGLDDAATKATNENNELKEEISSALNVEDDASSLQLEDKNETTTTKKSTNNILSNLFKTQNLMSTLSSEVKRNDAEQKAIGEEIQSKSEDYQELAQELEEKHAEYEKLVSEAQESNDESVIENANSLGEEINSIVGDLERIKTNVDNLETNLSSKQSMANTYNTQLNSLSKVESKLSKEVAAIKEAAQTSATNSVTSADAVQGVSAVSEVSSIKKSNALNNLPADISKWTIEDYGTAAIEKLSDMINLASSTKSKECLDLAVKEGQNNLNAYLDIDGDGKVTYKDAMGLMYAQSKTNGDDFSQKIDAMSDTFLPVSDELDKECEEKIDNFIKNWDKKTAIWSKDQGIAIIRAQYAEKKQDEYKSLRDSMVGSTYYSSQMFSKYISAALSEAQKNTYDLKDIEEFQKLYNDSAFSSGMSGTRESVSDTYKEKLNKAYSDMTKNLNINKIISDENWRDKISNLSGISDKQIETLEKASEYAKNNPETAKYAGLVAAYQTSTVNINSIDINQDGVVDFADLNSLPAEFDFDGDGVVSDKDKTRMSSLKQTVYARLKSGLQSHSGTQKIQNNTYLKSNWNIDDLVGMIKYADGLDNNWLSNKYSQENTIINRITDGIDYSFASDCDYQKIIDAIENSESETVKEKLSVLKEKAQALSNKSNEKIENGSLEEITSASGMQILTKNAKDDANALLSSNSSLSVNNLDFKPTDKAAYDYYMALDGKCTKSIIINGYTTRLEIIDGKIWWYCGGTPEHRAETLTGMLKELNLYDYVTNPLDADGQSLKIDMDKASELSGEPLIYGPQLCSMVSTPDGDVYSTHTFGADISEYTVLNNGKKIYSLYTKESRDNQMGLRITSNISQDSLNVISDFYAKKAGIVSS